MVVGFSNLTAVYPKTVVTGMNALLHMFVYSTSECQAHVGRTCIVAFNYRFLNYSDTFSLAVMICSLVQSCLFCEYVNVLAQ
jgi:hypothetical protein